MAIPSEAPAAGRAKKPARTRRSVERTSKPDGQEARVPYLTEAIVKRRRRILEVTQQMIAESGSGGFTVRDLGKRAGVSPTTIYTTYGDKENVIACAIEDFVQHLPLEPAGRSLEAVLAGIDEAARLIKENRAYVTHLSDLYFSRTVDGRIYSVIRDIGIASFLPWLQKIIKDGDTLPGLTLDFMCTELGNARWMATAAWSAGRITDDRLALSVKASFLASARGVTAGKTQERVSEALRKTMRLLSANGV